MFEGYNVADKNGGPAKDRFSDAAAVVSVYRKLSDDDIEESRRRLRIRKLYDGNLPYSEQQLASMGMKNLTNINFNGLKGTVDGRSDAILKLQSDTANLVELRPMARELAGPEAERVGEVVAEEFSAMLRSDGRFVATLAMMNKEADLYGLGPVTWPGPLDYAPVALERGQVRFMEDAAVVSSANDLYMFETTISPSFLQSVIDMGDVSSAMGWDVTEAKRVFKDVYRDGKETRMDDASPTGTTPAEAAQSFQRRNIPWEDRLFDRLHVIHAFVRETAWPRGITHIVVVPTAKDKFLFKRPNAYSSMDECFVWFPYSVKERYAREVRGLASFLYPVERLKNRLIGQYVDMAFRASSYMLTTPQGAGQAKLTLREQGPYTLLPPGIVPAAQQVTPDFQRLMVVPQLLDQEATSAILGTEHSPVPTTATRVAQGPSSRQTKAEVEMQQRLASHRTEADFAQRKDVIDRICRQTFLRAVQLASLPPFMRADHPEIDEWLRRCALRQVPPEIVVQIPQAYVVSACRDLALGADGKAAELDEFYRQYAGDIDEAGRRKIARKRAVLRFGVKEADQIAPEVSRDQAPSDQASFATVENNQMKMGFQVVVGQDQWHWSHIPVHSQLLQEIVEMVKAPEDNTPDLNEWNGDPNQTMQVAEQTLQNLQDDPKKILGILVGCSQHVQEHLAIGARQMNMQERAKQVTKMIHDLRSTIKALNLAVATQERVEQAEREKQEREMQELQRRADENELEKARYDVDKREETARYRVDREHEVAMHKAELEAQRESAKQGLAASAAAADTARKDAESEARIEREEKLSQARMNASNAAARMENVQNGSGYGVVAPSDVADERLDYAPL